MNLSRVTHPGTDSPRPLSRRAVVLSLLSLPAALVGCGGDNGGGESPPLSRTLPQDFALAYRVDPVFPPGSTNMSLALAPDETLIVTNSVANGYRSRTTEVVRVSKFGRPPEGVAERIARLEEGFLILGDVSTVTSGGEIYLPGYAPDVADNSSLILNVLSLGGEVRRSFVSDAMTRYGCDALAECPDGTFLILGVEPPTNRQVIARMDAEGRFLNLVMQGATDEEEADRNIPDDAVFSLLSAPAVSPTGDVYVDCLSGTRSFKSGYRRGFLIAKLDGSNQRFIPNRIELDGRNTNKKGESTRRDGEGNIYVDDAVVITYPNPLPPSDDPADAIARRGAVRKIAPDGTELGVALMPREIGGVPNHYPTLDFAVDPAGNIYVLAVDGAVYVFRRSR